MFIRPAPIVYLSDKSRCIVSIDVALSFGEHETWSYSKSPITGAWFVFRGEKHSTNYYPAGVGECV